MVKFTPDETQDETALVPYFDEARSKEGWSGQSTTKSIETLKAEVVRAVARLGGKITRFTRGSYEIDGKERAGYQIEYIVEAPDGKVFPGRFDIAALPVKKPTRGNVDQIERNRHKASVRMSLYNVVNSLEASWILQMLSPGYNVLIPGMLGDGEKTIGEIWLDAASFRQLTPPKPDDVEEGEFRDVEDE